MGKRKKEEKRRLSQERLSEMSALALSAGFGVQVYGNNPVHMRIFGPTVMDYWPSTSRAWATGSNEKARVMEPREVIDNCKHSE